MGQIVKLTERRFFNEFNSKPQLAPRAGAGYSPQTNMLMNFTNAGPVGEVDPWKARLDLAEALANQASSA
jgi:hypothetical protein